MEIKYKNSKDDIKILFEYINNRIDILKYYKAIMLLICIPIVVIGFFMWESPSILIYKGISSRDGKVIMVLFLVCILWMVGVSVLFKKKSEKQIEKDINYIDFNYEEDISLSIEEDMIKIVNGNVIEEYKYKYIKGVKKIRNYVNIRVKNGKIIMIPCDSIKEQVDKEPKEFISEIKKRIKG